MIPKLQRWQLVAFLVVAVLGIAYVGATYVRLDKMVGIGVYNVTARMRDSGGIFTNAEVTYRGVPVGRVGELRLTPTGVDVTLELDSSAPKVPANAKAVVAERSSIGELFVDLQPSSASGPDLIDGSVITAVQTPLPLANFLTDVKALSDSVSPEALKTVVTELSTALGGNGQNLRELIDALVKLSQTGIENLDATIDLIDNSVVALGTQAAQSDAITTWADSLTVIAAQLQSSDPDIRRLLSTGPQAATEISALLRQSGGDLTKVLHNLALDIATISPVSKNLQFVLITFPQIAAGGRATAPGDGNIHYGVVLETNNPPACTVGYEGTTAMIEALKKKNPKFDVNYDEFPFNTSASCDVAQGNPTGVRSADRARYADPSVPQPWDSTPKKAPDALNLGPIARQLSVLLGVRNK